VIISVIHNCYFVAVCQVLCFPVPGQHLNCIVRINSDKNNMVKTFLTLLILVYNNLRDIQYKLVTPTATSARDANFFSSRIISIWNSLPNSVVNADTVSCFYRRLSNLNLTDIERF
jgi:hypothetical protein